MPQSKEKLQSVIDRELAIFTQALLAIEHFQRNEPANEFFWMPSVVAGSDGIAAVVALQEIGIVQQLKHPSYAGFGSVEDEVSGMTEENNDESKEALSSDYAKYLIRDYSNQYLANFNLGLSSLVPHMVNNLADIFDDSFDLDVFEMASWTEANKIYIEFMYSNPREALQYSYQLIRYCYKEGASPDFVKRVELWEQRLKLAFDAYVKMQRNSFNRN